MMLWHYVIEYEQYTHYVHGIVDMVRVNKIYGRNKIKWWTSWNKINWPNALIKLKIITLNAKHLS